MSDRKQPDLPAKGQFLVYPTEDGRTKIEVQLEGETVWLTQHHMADLFQTTQQNISLHLQNIYDEGELQRAATHKEYLSVRQEGSRQVKRPLDFYNLDAIISVGYRVKSAVATRFRIWATQQLREFIVKGFVLDDERLKNPDRPFDGEITISHPNPNGIESLSPGLERSDYPGRTFFQATTPTGLRQARRADGRNPFRVEDVWFTVSQGRSCRPTLGWMTESPWDSPARDLEQTTTKLHGFLTINDRHILTHAGKISHEMAKELAEAEYDKFNRQRIQQADAAGGEFEKAIKQLPPPPKPKKKEGKK